MSDNGRLCGSCTLCCKLLPVPVLRKPAGVRCRHARTGKGCTIHENRPIECSNWSCHWLADRERTHAIPRPDRAHYVIDTIHDYITMRPHDGGAPTRIDAVQVWVDPAFPDAWRTPELRAFMLDQAERFRCATIVRRNSRDATTVYPPPFDPAGEWHEIRGDIVARDRSESDILSLADGDTPHSPG